MDPAAVPALTDLPLPLVAQLPLGALELLVLAANQPVRLQQSPAPGLADSGAAQRLCWVLRSSLQQLPAPEQDLGMAQAAWRQAKGMLDRALSPEGLQELLPVLSDREPQSARCARLELAAMLGWLLGAVPADEQSD